MSDTTTLQRFLFDFKGEKFMRINCPSKAVLCLMTVLQYYRHCNTIFDWENGGKFYLIPSRVLCNFRQWKSGTWRKGSCSGGSLWCDRGSSNRTLPHRAHHHFPILFRPRRRAWRCERRGRSTSRSPPFAYWQTCLPRPLTRWYRRGILPGENRGTCSFRSLAWKRMKVQIHLQIYAIEKITSLIPCCVF